MSAIVEPGKEIIASKPVLPTAQNQTSIPTDQILHSANAGVIVERTGQIKNEFRSEGRKFGRELAEYLNTSQRGIATVFVYEETFGTKDHLHWLIHARSLDDYETLVQMGTRDERFRELIFQNRIPEEKGGGGWDRMFLDGSLQEVVLIPQFWGMYGTKVDGNLQQASSVYRNAGPIQSVPPASEQVARPADQLFHSGNAGLVLHRVGQLKYRYRSEGRKFAREVAESINTKLGNEVTVFLYEEVFGAQDRLHWLTHLKSISTYLRLLELHVRDEEVRNLYFRERIPPEQGGGTWAEMFVEGSLVDTALTPQHWGMYATQPQNGSSQHVRE
jgi:Family of unknown function (DUF6039)